MLDQQALEILSSHDEIEQTCKAARGVWDARVRHARRPVSDIAGGAVFCPSMKEFESVRWETVVSLYPDGKTSQAASL